MKQRQPSDIPSDPCFRVWGRKGMVSYSWIAARVLVLVSLGRRAVLALPHELVALPGTTDALSLRLFVASSVGDAHFAAVASSAKVPPASVTAELLVDASLSDGNAFKSNVAKNGSFPVRASERSAYVIDGLTPGEAYDVFFVIEAANSNGLFSPVGRILGVSTNALAPAISSLTVVPVDARTNATQLSLSMDAHGVQCRVWYTLVPLQDTVLLEVERFSPREIQQAAQSSSSLVDLPQGLKGMRSPLIVNDGLESDTWYQVSAVSERAEGVFGEPVYATAKTHREPARVMDTQVAPVPGSTDSVAMVTRLDCSSAPMSDACGILSYRVMETPPIGSSDHVKPRQVAEGTAVIVDGRPSSHIVRGLAPGKAHSFSMAIETPGSNGAFGPTFEVATRTFPRAPRLIMVEVARSDAEPSIVTVRYKLSEPGVIHFSLVEKVDHPLALIGTMIGNQHGVSFSREVGISAGREDDEEEQPKLEGSQEIHGLAAGSAFEVMAQTESTLLGRPSFVFGEAQARLIEAVPPVLAHVRVRPQDASTTELLLEYDILGTAGTMHYALSKAQATANGGQGSLSNSAEAVKSAVEGEAGIVAAGSTFVSPGGSRSVQSSSSSRSRSSSNEGDSSEVGAAERPPQHQLRFRGLEPSKRYTISLCTESNSGTLSEVTIAEAEAHAEAPVVADVRAKPADRSAEAVNLAVALESSGLVHFVVRRAAEGDNALASRDHTIVYKGTREVNGTSTSTSSPPGPRRPPDSGVAGAGASAAAGPVLETIEGLEPNATYEIFIVTETANSNGVYRASSESFMATTHPEPPRLLDARARAADASSSALVVTASLASLAEVHYAVLPVKPIQTAPADGGLALGDGEAREQSPAASRSGAGSGMESDHDWSCGNVTEVVGDEWAQATALNETVDLAASGVVPSAAVSALLVHLAAAEEEAAAVASAAGGRAVAVAAAPPGADKKTASLVSSRPLEGTAVEVVFRVDGLEAAQAYSICLFTETPGSNGLFGGVHQLKPVSTHAPVPELASEGVACTLDCPGLNRDPCWLEANKCGECYEGFHGKAGHVNSPCGKVAALTEEDIARIADRELREAQQAQEKRGSGGANFEVEHDGDGSRRTVHAEGSPEQTGRHTAGSGGTISERIDSPGVSASPKPRLLMGVPIPTGPNVTHFSYVEVPNGIADGHSDGERGQGKSDFDVEAAASRLCEDLRAEGETGQDLPECLSSVESALSSRYMDGRFHLEDDPERPVLQVEVDAPGGESLAFTLRHGEEAGVAVVGFCRDNDDLLPDEQACVVTLMQEISS